jgi:hypothetical protein
MEFKFKKYVGKGVNHDKDEFEGVIEIQQLPHMQTNTLKYVATRLKDDVKVHEELGLLTQNENDELEFHLHMEELPCATLHSLKQTTGTQWVFEYQGKGKIAGFSSELVFEFNAEGFKYTHRWAMGGEVSDRSWCDFLPQPE